MQTDEIDPARVYRFGEFELNVRTRQLLRRGQPVAIQPKPFDLLVYLLRHRDRLVPREELLGEVWSGVHVDDEAVRFTLHAARKAVDDDGSRQAVIRTVPRAGFRLVAEVEEVAAPILRMSEASTRSPFLGRERLMERATSMLGEVGRGESRVLLLSGEAGIGKTRAVEQVSDLAERLGFKVFRGRCVESEGAPGFWPWVQVLRAAVSSDPPDNLLRALGEGAREVAWMVPELRPYVSDLPQTSAVDARAARFLMFDSVVAFFRELTRERPHVVSIDDLHRADPASVALFQHVARELGHAQAPNLLLVGTYREGELRVGPLHADSILSLATAPQSGHELLRGLERDDVQKLLEALSGRVPGSSVVDDLHEKTHGNPFFLHQIIGVLRSERRLAELESSESVELELPRHVQDVIRRQLDLLPGATRELIELAAVVGGDFSVRALELSADLERAEVFARIGVAFDAGVVAERPGEPDRYRFHHALVRDAIYAGLDRDLRGRLHARVARALEQSTPAEPSEHSASIAHHYEQSGDREDRIRAVDFYEMAASWSSARGAFEDAPGHLEKALSLLDFANPRTLVQRCRLLLRLGDAWGDAGMRERAREALQKAASLARNAGLREELATAALRFAPDLLA
ncbi:MAG TPA: AAA family ATPase, partial [Myxococcota bacterium]|nr:AAA family ATPase [Myxococcota bacterium]